MSYIQAPLSGSSATTFEISSRWYAVYTYPHHEHKVASQLSAKGVKTFLPTSVVMSRRKDRRVKLDMPVFPGYVFARISLSERHKVLGVLGVIRILSRNGLPIPINDEEINGVRICTTCLSGFTTQSFFELGDWVRVRSGMLEGLEGLVTNNKKNTMFIVPITLTHQAISFKVDVELLERLEKKPKSI